MESSKEIILSGLYMRKNKIMTGKSNFSVEDVGQMGEKTATRFGAKVRALDEYQLELILKINKLIEKFNK